MRKRSLSLLLVLAMVCSFIMIPAAAEGTWYDEAMDTWASRGVLAGDESGNLNPEANITRAQLATMLDSIMDYQVKAENTFADVQTGAWYVDYVLKANAAGVLSGDGVNVRPDDSITRQEAAVMLARVMHLSNETAPVSSFTDEGQIASWALNPVRAMAAKGFIAGSDGKMNPNANITRAEVAVILHSMFNGYFAQAGTYTDDVDGNAVINADNVTLKNMAISGDLIIAEGVANGHIVLDSVTLGGKLIVRGGGENSIIIRGDSTIDSVVVARQDGKVRVSVEGNANVSVIYVDDGNDNVKIEGTVTTVTVAAADTTVEITGKVETVEMTESATGAALTVAKGATVETVSSAAPQSEVSVAGNVSKVETTAAAASSTVTVDSGAKVGEVAVAASGTELNVAGTVTKVEVTEQASNTAINTEKGAKVDSVTTAGSGTVVQGDGAVKDVTVTGGEGTQINTPGTNVENKSDAPVDVGGSKVPSGETGKADGNVPSGGGSSGGGGGTTPTYKYNVSIGSFTGGTVTADVTQTNDDNKKVTLTVTPEDGWKLTALTVTKTGAQPQDIMSDKSFTMDAEGTYTVNATFVQPLTAMEAFIVNDADSIAKMAGYGYTTETLPENVSPNPWLFIGVTKGADAVGKVTISSITFNGSDVSAPSSWNSGFNMHAMAYVGNAPESDKSGDALKFTGDAAAVVVTVECDGVTYTASCDYTKPGVTTTHTVSFNSNGGTAVSGQIVAAGGKATEPTVTKTGYDLEGWYKEAGLTNKWNFNDSVNADITLYAKWEAKDCTLTYDNHGADSGTGKDTASATVKFNEAYGALPEVKKTGYTLKGWFTAETGGTQVTADTKMTTEGATIHAQWTPDETVRTFAALKNQLADSSISEIILGDSIEITGAMEIPAGKTLVVPAGKGLTVTGTLTNNGTIVVNDATSLNTAVNAGGLVQLGSSVETANGIDLTTKATSTLDLNGQAITSASSLNFHTIAVRDGGSLTIQDTKGNGSVSGTTQQDSNAVLAAYPDANLTVKGGTFTMHTKLTGQENNPDAEKHGNRVVQNSGTMIIDGGTFELTGTSDMNVILCFNKGTITINDGLIETGDNVGILVDSIDSENKPVEGTKVTMAGGEIKNGKTAVGVVDGAVFEMTGGKITSTDSGADVVGEGSKFILSGGTVDAAKHGVSVFEKGEFEMTRGTITSKGHAINGGNASDQKDVGYKITISGGTATSTDTGMYLPVSGTVNISNSAIVHGDKVGIAIRGGALNISGGTVSANAVRNEDGDSKSGQSGTLTGAIILGQPSDKYPEAITVTITGNPVIENKANDGDKIVLDLGCQQATWTVTGGDTLVTKNGATWSTSAETTFSKP